MDASFWHRKWEANEIGFHQREANPLLVQHFAALSLLRGQRVFVPLCGKTRDIHWLLSNGFRVAGCELSQIAVEQLFAELAIEPNRAAREGVHCYSANNIDIFVGDIFELSRNVVGRIDAIYDRAALVALPESTRGRYAAHLIEISERAPQLLISFDYDQRLLDGPPFSVGNDKIAQYYQGTYDVTLLASVDVIGGLKGKCAAKEEAWLLKA